MSHKSQKNIFVVLGIARSGTSVIAKALNVLGIDLGNNLNPSNKWNPKGFWEDLQIVYGVNQKILDTLNCELGVFRLINAEELASQDLQELNQLAMALLESRLMPLPHWGFKDPNTVRVLPFWQAIFKELQLKENYVIALRNPLESADSYRNHIFKYNQEKTLFMWLLHLLPAIDKTHGKNRVIVNYDSILKNPVLELERIKKNLQIATDVDTTQIDTYVNEFLDKQLRHSEYSYEDLKSHRASAIVPLCLKAYELLLKLAADEITDNDSFVSAWDDIMREFYSMYPMYLYVDTVLRKNVELEKSLHKVHRSLVWRMLLPVRKIKDIFRNRRIKLKKSKLRNLRTMPALDG